MNETTEVKSDEASQPEPAIMVRAITDDPDAPQLRRYRSHKVVEALKIHAIEETHDGEFIVTPELGYYRPFEVSREYVEKHKPQAGGYWVRYQDGYESWSPADAFEKGYSAIVEAEPELSEDESEPDYGRLLSMIIDDLGAKPGTPELAKTIRRLEMAREELGRANAG